MTAVDKGTRAERWQTAGIDDDLQTDDVAAASRFLSTRQGPELMALCEQRGLKTTGDNSELIQRLLAKEDTQHQVSVDVSIGEAARLALQNQGRARGSVCNDALWATLDWRGRLLLADELKGAASGRDGRAPCSLLCFCSV